MRSPRSVTPTSPAPPHRLSGMARTAVVLAVPSVVLVILVAISWSPLLDFDRSVAEWLHRWAVDEPGLVHVNRVLTDWFWDPWTMRVLIAVAFGWLWWRGERVLAVWVAATSAVGTFIQQGLKASIGRERPQWPDPVDSAHFAAFPSGHAMTATVACALLVWLAVRHGVTGRTRLWCVVLAAVSVAGAGGTRLFLGVHWPTDVLAGWLLGACWVALSITAYHRLELSRRH
ncbi:phosphatase PAP2 family protein [Streptomyces sp. NPDC020965]|uniref:phosphatase PAP2 family protein n=1 Tax=Streptomyces sp. NPDC020965 TaxID=3365105 RepID=UPI0037A68121